MAISADAILSIIASEAGLDEAMLRPEATLADLNIGSLDVVSVVFELEDRFGIELAPEDIPPTATISQFVEIVQSMAGK